MLASMIPLGSIRVPENAADLTVMWDWLSHQHTIALDTETTGLDVYADGHRLRLIALATPSEAWVFPFEIFQRWSAVFVKALNDKRLIMHNASYDIAVLSVHLGMDMTKLWSQTKDTKILAHQVDPRGREEGGIGQSLEELVKHYMPEYAKLGDDLKDEFLRLKSSGAIPKKTPLADMWKTLPIDNEMYLLYAGTDAILTARLFRILSKLVDINSELTRFDHKGAMIACGMDSIGFMLDSPYATSLRDDLERSESEWKAVAQSFGLENINSPDQVYHALKERGIVPTEVTPKGNPKVDKVFLNSHAEDPLVKAIIEGKRAGKWRTTWVEKFLNGMSSSGRVHPSTNTLRARTARFSITGIPAQTLPSSDSLIRSCFIADAGERIVGVDYSNQEPRFAAAKAPDARMIRAYRNGEDPYVVVADAAWKGRGLEMRKQGKGGLLTTLYGGGTKAMMDQWGMTAEQSGIVQRAIRKTFPGLKQLGDRLAVEAERNGYITTWTGRRLPVDQHRLYSALNYYVQSGCRDITVSAMVRLYEAGYLPHMRLAIHDELILSLPYDADVREVERIMSTKVGPLEIPAQAKIGSRSWGSLYEKE